ncbi:hypothetical protein CRG98_004250 [Punica granatum]|uniref:Uncharacterized protein n=1 Tax=Punica granatum TaxID=22663 RepID=A0A2I0L5F2_PUNGR|nr:hypothetical protein CRG98_004250 [Punica granatum]
MAQDRFDFYTLVFHHGGVLQIEPHVAYIGGEVDAWDMMDMDHHQVVDEAITEGERNADGDDDGDDGEDDKSDGDEGNEGNDGDDDINMMIMKGMMGEDVDDDTNIESEVYGLENSKVSSESSNEVYACGNKPKWRAHNQKPKNGLGQSRRDDIAILVERADGATEEVPEQEEEYYTEELESLKGSEDEEEESKPLKFNEAAAFGNVYLELYMLFPNLDVFKEAVMNYIIAQGRPIQFPKNDKVRCMVRCGSEECDWEILCSWAEAYGCYQVKYFNPNNTCSRKMVLPQADMQWIVKKLVDILRLTPKMTAADAYAYMATTYQIQVA